MNISMLGAGAWGTALAMAAAQRHDVLLWTRDVQQAVQMDAQRRNDRYLPELPLPAALRISADHDAALRHAQDGLLVIAAPMAALRERLAALPADMPALWLCKGFEAGSGELGHEIARDLRPGVAAGVLSGPSFALEVAREQPTALANHLKQTAATGLIVLVRAQMLGQLLLERAAGLHVQRAVDRLV